MASPLSREMQSGSATRELPVRWKFLARFSALRSVLWATAAIFAVATAAPASDEIHEDTASMPTSVPHAPDLLPGLSAFVDGAVTEAMRRDHIAGVGVAVVDHSAVLLAKGYGVAALSPERDMNADTPTR